MKKRTGRPLLFNSPAELELKIQSYFNDCNPHIESRLASVRLAGGSSVIKNVEYMTEQVPYTVSGLARSLGTSRRTLLNYQNRSEDFFHTVTRAKDKIEDFWECALFDKRTAKGAIFTLGVNFQWYKKASIDKTYPQAR